MAEHSVDIWVDFAQVCHRGANIHPEHPRRVTAIVERLQKSELPIEWHTKTDIMIPNDTLQTLKWTALTDGDCYETPYTARILLRVIVMINEAVDMIFKKTIRCGFILARPPGHHADMKNGSRGFCHMNNVWIAVEKFALHGITNIGILDWDVHHGDGTEELVRTHRAQFSEMRFVSIHAYGPGIYPGTGESSVDENIMNIGLSRGTAEDIYLKVFVDQALPFLGTPDILIVSAGYDAHKADPMKYMKLESTTYGKMTKYLKGLGCPVLFVLEGGYNPVALAESVEETIKAWSLS